MSTTNNFLINLASPSARCPSNPVHAFSIWFGPCHAQAPRPPVAPGRQRSPFARFGPLWRLAAGLPPCQTPQAAPLCTEAAALGHLAVSSALIPAGPSSGLTSPAFPPDTNTMCPRAGAQARSFSSLSGLCGSSGCRGTSLSALQDRQPRAQSPVPLPHPALASDGTFTRDHGCQLIGWARDTLCGSLSARQKTEARRKEVQARVGTARPALHPSLTSQLHLEHSYWNL